MSSRTHTLVLALALIAMGCSDSSPTQSVVPAPPTTDDLIIADCYEIQAALEAYAAGNGGEYPSHWQDVDAFVASVKRPNRYTGLETEPRLIEAEWPGEIGVVLYYELDFPECVLGYRINARGSNGTLFLLENIESVSPDALAVYELMRHEVDLVESALQQFMEDAGRYPGSSAGDTTPLGQTVIDLLPGGQLLFNPILMISSNPLDGSASGMAGSVGYEPIGDHSSGTVVAYSISATGPHSPKSFLIRSRCSKEDRWTLIAMYLVRHAVDSFLFQASQYPTNVDLDETPSGDTVLDLLPAMTNVYTGTVMTPRNGLATAPGEIGYQPVIENDVVVGYVINGFGIVKEFYRIEVLP